MLRQATAQDQARIVAFLSRHRETSMFLLGNLAAHGFGSEHPHGTSYFLWEENGDLRAVFGQTNSGYLAVQNPDKLSDAAIEFAQTALQNTVLGITGDAEQVPQVTEALGFPQSAYKAAVDEPLFSLQLSNLHSNLPVDELRPVTPDDTQMLVDWFRAYEVDTGLSTPGPAVDKRAIEAAERAIHKPTLRILEEKNIPIAMTDFNAVLPDIVQIGGVFVRREFRNRGVGRRIVASHLDEARRNGVRQAVLFAASQTAARCYESIGFKRIGSYRICLLADKGSQP